MENRKILKIGDIIGKFSKKMLEDFYDKHEKPNLPTNNHSFRQDAGLHTHSMW